MRLIKTKLISKSEEGQLKRLPTKSTVVHGKTKVFTRNQHVQNNKEVKPHEKSNKDLNINDHASYDNSERLSRTFDLTDDDIKNGKVFESGGQTKDITKVRDADGNLYYSKPVAGEKLFINDLTDPKKIYKQRESLTLYDKETGHSLEGARIYRNQLGTELGERFKGTMADREVMASRLADELGMDHIPRAEKRIIDGKEHVISEDANSMHGDRYEKVQNDQELMFDEKKLIFDEIAKDPHVADKILFDVMIGNMDRHGGNILLGTKHDGGVEMIGIDHGIAFSSDNKLLKTEDNLNMTDLIKKLKLGNVSSAFEKKLNELHSSSNYEQYKKDLTDTISPAETKAFDERVNYVMSTIKKYKKV